MTWTQGRLRSPREDSDQPGHPPRVFAHAQWVAKDPNFLHGDNEDSDQTGQMPRLIWVFAGCACHFVGFVIRRLNSACQQPGNFFSTSSTSTQTTLLPWFEMRSFWIALKQNYKTDWIQHLKYATYKHSGKGSRRFKWTKLCCFRFSLEFLSCFPIKLVLHIYQHMLLGLKIWFNLHFIITE